ncbi:MAG: DUF4395 family protein [Bacteroidota bacterium]
MLSPRRKTRLEVQGMLGYSRADLDELKYGIRFAYVFCGFLVLMGVISQNLYLLGAMNIIAFGGVILKNHPFDYLYNYGLRHLLKKPPIPHRPPQIRFACVIATFWLLATHLLFMYEWTVSASIMGYLLVSIAALVGFTDICIPSIIYNVLYQKKIKTEDPLAQKF